MPSDRPSPPSTRFRADRRRANAALGLALLGGGLPTTAGAAAGAGRTGGRLFIIGGAEDRRGEKEVLRRFVELCAAGRRDGPLRIAVLPAATAFPDAGFERYDQALADLGVTERVRLAVQDRADAADPRWIAELQRVDGVLMGGGNQRRLMEVLDGSPLAAALQQGFARRQLCVAGSSAGAAAMSARMLVGRDVTEGLGLLPGAIVDQHFSERRRLPRLLAAVAAQPALLGIGVDEDTGLALSADGFDVVGSGGVTVVDARRMAPGEAARLAAEDLEALRDHPDLRLAWLPYGTAHHPGRGRQAPALHRWLAAALQPPSD
ncbi:cyanophycinase [Aquabacterium sp. J223]|uniref:cyanophycinase n=1 Tax=Aquabacterium sp. J223 TaxID=2898431 RepID=UPI0021ADCFB4|nr:cyanophycinase [Aquabacterium sp. J223]UUX94873.1 cyanophycinase [Aquabacterium sp. J223]